MKMKTSYQHLKNSKYDGNENIENDLEYPDSVECDRALAAELEDKREYKDDEEDHHQHHHHQYVIVEVHLEDEHEYKDD